MIVYPIETEEHDVASLDKQERQSLTESYERYIPHLWNSGVKIALFHLSERDSTNMFRLNDEYTKASLRATKTIPLSIRLRKQNEGVKILE